MSNYEDAKNIAQKLINLEVKRLDVVEEQKQLKDELMQIFSESEIDTTFEFNDGTVFLEFTESYKIPDGLKELLALKVTKPDKINPDLVEKYIEDGARLNKVGKKTLKESLDTDLASMIIVDEKEKIKVKVR